MITILEGPDFAGKTTYANSLPGRVIHNGPPPRSATDLAVHYEQQLLAIDPREDVIFDRLWVGELIYGPIYRGSSRITYQEHLRLGTLARTLGARLIHVDASDRVLLKRFRGDRGDELIKEQDTLMRIAAQYRVLLDGIRAHNIGANGLGWERIVTTVEQTGSFTR